MASFTKALSSILDTIADKALDAEEKRTITGTAVRVALIHKTNEQIAQTTMKAEEYKAQSPVHAQLYDAANAEIQKRLEELALRRGRISLPAAEAA